MTVKQSRELVPDWDVRGGSTHIHVSGAPDLEFWIRRKTGNVFRVCPVGTFLFCDVPLAAMILHFEVCEK